MCQLFWAKLRGVVVRSDKLDEKGWVYKAVESWAYEHSDIPILFATNPSAPKTK